MVTVPLEKYVWCDSSETTCPVTLMFGTPMTVIDAGTIRRGWAGSSVVTSMSSR